MSFFIVTGRVLFDDEDSAEIVEASSQAAAEKAFERRMREYASSASAEVVVNMVFECETEPKLVRSV